MCVSQMCPDTIPDDVGVAPTEYIPPHRDEFRRETRVLRELSHSEEFAEHASPIGTP